MIVSVELHNDSDDVLVAHEYSSKFSDVSEELIETPNETFQIAGEGEILVAVKLSLNNFLASVFVYQNDEMLLNVGFSGLIAPPFVVQLKNGNYIQLYFDLESEKQEQEETRSVYTSLQWDSDKADAKYIKEFRIIVPEMRYTDLKTTELILSNISEWPIGMRSKHEIEKLKPKLKYFQLASKQFKH